jgi:hypothetical protein
MGNYMRIPEYAALVKFISVSGRFIWVLSGKGWHLHVIIAAHVKKNFKSLNTDAQKAQSIIGFSDSAACTIYCFLTPPQPLQPLPG